LANQAVILAGGLATRLNPVTGGLPKALVDIDGKPLIHRQLELLAHHGFTEVLLLLRHGADIIKTACGDGGHFGVHIECVVEQEPRGTAGAVLMARDRLQPTFAVLYGDTVLNVDLRRMQAAHRAVGAAATLFVHPNNHPYDSDLVEADESGRIVAFHSKPHPPEANFANLVNAALYFVEARCLTEVVPPPGIFDFGAHLFPALLQQGARLHAYRSREYISDAGTPERLAAVVADVKSGRVGTGSLETPAPAIFLDRDGTLNDDPGYITDPDAMRLFPGVGKAIRRLNRSPFLAVVVTNQSVVARGGTDEAGLQKVHNRLEGLLSKDGAYLDAIYYCPHHPDRGFAGERPELKIVCSCRKPATGLIDRAVADMNIDLTSSWMIGDSFIDVEFAHRAGILSALVGTGNGGRDERFAQRPDFDFSDLTEAVDFILDAWPSLAQQARRVADQIDPGDLVLIGGLARSGKSAFASALKWQLGRRGRSAHVLSLDGWLRPHEARPKAGSVLDRFDIAAIERLIALPLSASSASIAVPLYNRQIRRPDKQYTLDVGSSDVVIAEGVIALAHPFASERRTIRIFISRDEDRRYNSLAADYRARDFSDEEFEALYAGRQNDETPIIAATRRHADIILKTP